LELTVFPIRPAVDLHDLADGPSGVEVSPGTVQDLLRGYKGSGQNRPRATKPESTHGSEDE
jgi:hypothetical protein